MLSEPFDDIKILPACHFNFINRPWFFLYFFNHLFYGIDTNSVVCLGNVLPCQFLDLENLLPVHLRIHIPIRHIERTNQKMLIGK